MAHKTAAIVSHHTSTRGSFNAYLSGYALSVVLTLLAYLLVKPHALAHQTLIVVVASLALVQLIVQLVFFLHLSQDSRPRWRLVAFGFMILVVAILVYGSIWIMHNLDYNMRPTDINTYMKDHEGI